MNFNFEVPNRVVWAGPGQNTVTGQIGSTAMNVASIVNPFAAILAAGSAAYFAVNFTAAAKAGVGAFEVAAETGVSAFEVAADRANTTFEAGVSAFEASTGAANTTFKSLTEGTCDDVKTVARQMGKHDNAPYLVVAFVSANLVLFYWLSRSRTDIRIRPALLISLSACIF